MTDVAAPVRSAPGRVVDRQVRLEPIVFAHARLAMLTVTGDGTVVDINDYGADFLGRRRSEMVQEPIERHLAVRSGATVADCLAIAARSTGPASFGPCFVRRSGGDDAVREFVVSSGLRIAGQDLLLVQLAPVGG